MYVIQKDIGNFKYWWNVDKGKWEGLINNATLFNTASDGNLIGYLRSKFGNRIFFVKID